MQHVGAGMSDDVYVGIAELTKLEENGSGRGRKNRDGDYFTSIKI